jgi:two-component system cell cycle sensor histidine kinase/response regulator CckA
MAGSLDRPARPTGLDPREAAELLAKAFSASPDALSVHETLSGRFVDVNPGFHRLTGYSRDEVVGRTSAEIGIWANGADRETFVARLQRDGSVREFTVEIRTSRGDLRICELSAERIEIGGRAHNLSVLRDITDRERTQAALRENRRTMATLLDNLPGMAYRCRNDPAWTMEFVSEGSRALTGYAPGELLAGKGVVFADLILPEFRQPVWDGVQAALKERRAFELTYRLRRRDGSVGWMWERGQGVFDAAGELAAIEGFITDITALKTAEEDLRKSEEKFSKAFRSSPQPLIISDRETGQYLDVNDGFLRVSGYTRDEVIGRTSVELATWANPAERADVVQRLARDGHARNLEIGFRVRDGRHVIMRCSFEAFELGGRPCILSVLEDLTEQRRAEQVLRESEEKFAKAFRASPSAISISELATGRFIDVNAGFERLTGYSRGELVGSSGEELNMWVNPGDRARLLGELEKSGMVRSFRIQLRARSGEVRDALLFVETVVIGHQQCLVVLGHDISEQLLAERALRDSEAKFATAFQASPTPLTIVELATGAFIEVNHAFERVSGYSRAEAIGRTTIELGLWREPADREAFAAQLDRDGLVRDLVLTYVVRGGAEVVMRGNFEVIQLGGKRCILGVLEDITEERRAEQERAELELHLRQSQKLEALGTLAGGIAHDFNNILTAIVMNQELAMMDLTNPAELTERLSEIGRASNRARDLVRQILTFSRHQSSQARTRQRLAPIVQEAMGLVRSSLPATIEIEQDFSPDAPRVMADGTQVHQIVMNLCTNAAHAMRDRPGRIAVRLARSEIDAAHAQPGLDPGCYAHLAISDNGHGMDESVLSRIFEPFFTTKGPGEGTGLGLAVVHGIVKDHGGGIFVRSRRGEGTTFDIFFPEATEAGSAKPFAEAPPVGGRGESVLVVDDELAVGSVVGRMLRKLGYRVEVFTDPEAGLARFHAAPADFDVVLTDRTMPRLTGPELIARVRAVRPEMPAMLMSGLNNPAPADEARYQQLTKPINLTELAHAIRIALAETPTT